MRLDGLDLGPRLRALPVPQESAAYKTIAARLYAEMWRANLHVWKMHGINGQFTTVVIDGKPRNGIPATKHCVAQAARAQVLAEMLGVPLQLIKKLVAGVLLTDSYKFAEWRYMQECEGGPSWDSYAEAQRQAHLSWQKSGLFDEFEETVAASVAHETLLMMQLICGDAADGKLDDYALCQLIAHYVDDISRDHDWVKEVKDGKNVLDLRMERNAANSTYARLNEQGRERLRQEAEENDHPHLFTLGETTYEAQARVGHMVETLLAELLATRAGRDFRSLDLPVIIDNEVNRRIGLAYRDLRRGGVQALRSRPILSRR